MESQFSDRCLLKKYYIFVLIFRHREMSFAPGYNALREHLFRHYPNEIDPYLIPRCGLPHWLGGNEALDCIFVYESDSYWHFITAGLSDLYGDGRVLYLEYEDNQSGFGIELTMRVRKSGTDVPQWPIFIFHKLARYIFESGNRIMPGDDFPWRAPIDQRDSILTNFLATSDELLKQVIYTAKPNF